MTEPVEGAGLSDLVATFMGAGLQIPPVPESFKSRLIRREEWFWSSRELDRGRLYDPNLLVDEATAPVDDYLSIAHVGHGVNSYFLTYQLVQGPLALFAQTDWGGVDGGGAEANALRLQYDSIQKVLARVPASPDGRSDDMRLLVIESRSKAIDMCTWVMRDGRARQELLRWPRGLGWPSALSRAAQELGRLDPAIEADGSNVVSVGIESSWDVVGEVTLTADRLAFPATLPARPGLYRFLFQEHGPIAAYLGETADLRRRAGHYRIGNASQLTNKRLHDLMTSHLGSGGRIEMAIALSADSVVAGQVGQLDLGRKSARLLAESAAIHAVPAEWRLLNMPGVGEDRE